MRPRPWTMAVLAALLAVPGKADEPSAADIAGARLLALEGIRLANAGKCKDAVDKLSRAESLHPAPTILGRLGECQVSLGKLVEGTENLRRVAHEPLPRGAPSAFVRAKARAERVLAANAKRVAHLHIVLNAPPEARPTVTVDGEPVPPELVGADRPSDPGPHAVEATAPGYLKAGENVSLLEGADATVMLDLRTDPDAVKQEPVKAPGPATAAPVAPGPPAPSGPSRVPAIVALAAGGAGLAVGAIFGAIAVGDHGTLESACNADKVCPGSAAGTLDSLRTTSTVSTIAFIAGGAGVAAGVVLLFVPIGRRATKAEQGRVLLPYVGPAAVGIAGMF